MNLASVNYHFGSKEGLLEAVLLRSARPIVEERLRLLAECAEAPGRPPLLEQILDAYVSPALSLGRAEGADGVAFRRLRARLTVEGEHLYRRLLTEAFDDSSRRCLLALQAALPHLPPELVAWRFHFTIGTVVFCQADSGRIESLTDGAINTTDVEETRARLIPFLAAAFRAPA